MSLNPCLMSWEGFASLSWPFMIIVKYVFTLASDLIQTVDPESIK